MEILLINYLINLKILFDNPHSLFHKANSSHNISLVIFWRWQLHVPNFFQKIFQVFLAHTLMMRYDMLSVNFLASKVGTTAGNAAGNS